MKAAAALHRRKERDRQDRYLLEGPRYVADVLSGAPDDLVEIFASPAAAAPLSPQAAGAGVPLTVVDADVLERLAASATPQGVVAVVRRRASGLQRLVGRGHLVVLCGVADPGNAGTIVRTAAASGAAGVAFTTGSVDPWNPKAVRAAAGTLTRTQLAVDVAVDDVLAHCGSAGQRVVALDADARDPVWAPGVLAPPVALLFGNEAHGLPAGVLDDCDATAAVPRFAPVESLNLAAAAAITVYAAARASRSDDIPGSTPGTPIAWDDRDG